MGVGAQEWYAVRVFLARRISSQRWDTTELVR